MEDLRFPDHSAEKLEELNYYYKVWFDIVKRQKCYIIDAYAGTGTIIIEGSKRKLLGSALLAVDLFKVDTYNKLNVVLINIDSEECVALKSNVESHCKEKNIDAELDNKICIINEDWSSQIEDLILKTSDGISFFLLDPYGIKTMPWNKVEMLAKKGKSIFGHKESGFEVLINWAWHKVRREIGDYYKKIKENPENITETRFKNMDAFFGSINWREIVNKYSPDMFDDKDDFSIDSLMNELVVEYAKLLLQYFKYIKIHPVYARKKGRRKYHKERGKVIYFLIFASNYYDALDIIDKKFKKYREMKVFSNEPTVQMSLDSFFGKKPTKEKPKKKKRITIRDKLKKLKEEAGIKIYKGALSEGIIKFLYERKNFDYGCYNFALFNEFEIKPYNPTLQYLLNENILGKRKKIAKSGSILWYYYLTHPVLVDRGEYLFYNDKVYEFKDNKLVEF